MSTSPKKPRRKRRPPAYVCACGFCGDGKLRFWKHGGKIVALCDDCELVWDDVPAVAADPKVRATGSYSDADDGWRKATLREISRAGFNRFIGGRSD